MVLGMKVRTLKGDRMRSPFQGIVDGFTKFREYDAVWVLKEDGKRVRCLVKNLVPVRPRVVSMTRRGRRLNAA